MKNLSAEQFLERAKTEQNICLFEKIPCDLFTPIQIFSALIHKFPQGTILESGLNNTAQGKYSHLGFSPLAELSIQNQTVFLTKHNKKQIVPEKPFDAARALLTEYTCHDVPDAIKFIGGGVGYLNYDAVRLFESIPEHPLKAADAIDFLFIVYRLSITFDHSNQSLFIALNVQADNDPSTSYAAACEEIDEIKMLITTPTDLFKTQASFEPHAVHTDIDDQQFMTLIEQAKQHIIAGDIFQIVLSRQFIQNIHVRAFDVYRALRSESPAPYMFYFDRGDSVILGASPERLVSLEGQTISIMPIAGTRARKQADDESLIHELLNDEKELAEHMMLVDLARNDIGTVAKPGSIKIIELAQAKIFSHVIHIVTLIEGTLAPQFDALDLLQKVFPAGTVSGAPKIRAMELINTFETSARGLYGGSVFYIDHKKNLESCLAIRMAVIRNQQVTIRTGAGIVYDSDPYKEAEETRSKAQSILDAINTAEKGGVR